MLFVIVGGWDGGGPGWGSAQPESAPLRLRICTGRGVVSSPDPPLSPTCFPPREMGVMTYNLKLYKNYELEMPMDLGQCHTWTEQGNQGEAHAALPGS